MNTVVMCRGRAYFLKSTEVVSNSGEQCYAVALEAKKFLESRGIQVVATVVTMPKGFKMRCSGVLLFFVVCCKASVHFSCSIESEDPACVTIRCAAHSLQLLLKDLEGTPLVRSAVSTMEGLLERLENVELQDKLKLVQKVASGNKEEGCLPVKPVDTRCVYMHTWPTVPSLLCVCGRRWSSKIYAMERLIKLKPYLQLVLPGVC